MTTEEKLKTRAIIQFCVNLGKTPVETMKMMNSASERTPVALSVARSLVYKWHKRYSDGRETVCDDERSGRPVTCRRESDVELVKCVLNEDRRITLDDLCSKVDMSYGTVRRIIKDDLEMSRISARWVPRLLSEEDQKKRVTESRRFLKRFEKDGYDFMNKIVTADETWLYYFDPETKQQSSQWKSHGSPPPKKARCVRSTGKHMFIVFFDINGPILLHAVPKGKTVTGSYYAKVLKRDLGDALRKKRPHILHDGFILHHDNAPSHVCEEVKTTATIQLEAEILPHPPYSPDLAPCDFALFPRLKKQLKGNHFSGFEELQLSAQTLLYGYKAEWFKEVYKSWIVRHRRCVEAGGAYFEKD